MEEIWKPIPGFIDYAVSNFGRVKSFKGQNVKLLKPQTRVKGYKFVNLSNKVQRKSIDIHRLVLMAFVEMPPVGKECDHINRVRDDNRLDNLRWVTKRENVLNSGLSKKISDTFYHGVKTHTDNRKKKYRVQFRVKGKDVHFGTFYTFEEAKQKAIQVKQNNIL
jgi:hypothetical protein